MIGGFFCASPRALCLCATFLFSFQSLITTLRRHLQVPFRIGTSYPLAFKRFTSYYLTNTANMLQFCVNFACHARAPLPCATCALSAFRRRPSSPLSPLQSALPRKTPATPLESALTISLDLKSFRMNTSEKRGEGVSRLSAFSEPPAFSPLRPTFHSAHPSARSRKPCPTTSSRSLFTTHHPLLTQSKTNSR